MFSIRAKAILASFEEAYVEHESEIEHNHSSQHGGVDPAKVGFNSNILNEVSKEPAEVSAKKNNAFISNFNNGDRRVFIGVNNEEVGHHADTGSVDDGDLNGDIVEVDQGSDENESSEDEVEVEVEGVRAVELEAVVDLSKCALESWKVELEAVLLEEVVHAGRHEDEANKHGNRS